MGGTDARRRRAEVAAAAEGAAMTWREDKGVSCHVPLFPKLPKKFSSASALPGYTMAEVGPRQLPGGGACLVWVH